MKIRERKDKWVLYDGAGWVLIITRDKSVVDAVARQLGAARQVRVYFIARGWFRMGGLEVASLENVRGHLTLYVTQKP